MKIVALIAAALITALPAEAARLTVRAADGFTTAEEMATMSACSARMCELWRLHACGREVSCDPRSNSAPSQLCPGKTLKPRSIVRSMTCTE